MVAYNAAIDACSGRWLEAMLLNRELLQRGDAGCGGPPQQKWHEYGCVLFYLMISRGVTMFIVIYGR